jgi:hypothetical protein
LLIVDCRIFLEHRRNFDHRRFSFSTWTQINLSDALRFRQIK